MVHLAMYLPIRILTLFHLPPHDPHVQRPLPSRCGRLVPRTWIDGYMDGRRMDIM